MKLLCMGGPANGLEVDGDKHGGRWVRFPRMEPGGIREAVYERSGDVMLFVRMVPQVLPQGTTKPESGDGA